MRPPMPARILALLTVALLYLVPSVAAHERDRGAIGSSSSCWIAKPTLVVSEGGAARVELSNSTYLICLPAAHTPTPGPTSEGTTPQQFAIIS